MLTILASFNTIHYRCNRCAMLPLRTSLYDDLEKIAKSELDVGMPEDRSDGQNSPSPLAAGEGAWVPIAQAGGGIGGMHPQ